LWGDGEILFSAAQLGSLINEQTVLLTVQRGDEVFQTKVPRVQIDDLRMSAYERGEIDDWQHEAGLKGRLQDLYFVPYNFSPSASVEKHLEFIDREDQIKAFDRCERCAYFNPLQEGDQVIAVDGKRIDSSYELLQALQTRKVLLIVQRDPEAIEKINWTQASSIGSMPPISQRLSLRLEPIIPFAPRDLYIF
jgi:regulator of sigma E protease